LLGNKVVQLALESGHEVYSLHNKHPTNFGVSIRLDLTDKSKVSKVVSRLKPEAIIHAAAYTDVDGCEINKDQAWRVNAEATRHIATASASVGAHLTYVSTDYVFNGKKGLYSEEDNPNPINYYGYTKLKGEEFVRKQGKEYCIARPSVVYGWGRTDKPNFSMWLINSLDQGSEVKILTDQYVSPTLNTNLAEMLLEIMHRRITGILHTAGATRTNRYKFALKLAETFGLTTDLVKPAKIDQMLWKARRPYDSSLNVSRASALLNVKPLRLKQALEMMKRERIADDQSN